MIQTTRTQRYLLSLLSGLLMVLAFPFTGSMTPLFFVAWVPLLLVEHSIYSSNYRSGKVFIHAYIVFFVYNLGTTWWIWNASAGGAIMAFILNALLMSLAFLIFHHLKKSYKNTYSLVWLLATWIGFEYLHYHWELSWPWLNLGNVFSIRPQWVQWYSITGILGGTAWILAVNFSLYVFVRDRLFKKYPLNKVLSPLFVSLILIAIPIVGSLISYFNYTETGKSTEVVVVQPNIDPYNEKFTASLEDQLNNILSLAIKKISPKTTLVMAPETALSWTFYEEDLTLLPFYKQIRQQQEQWDNADLYIGASTARFFEKRHSRASRKLAGGPGYIENYNASLLLRKDKNFEFLHKSKLVLGVEKVPFSDWIPFLEKLSIDNGGTSGTLGIEKRPKTLQSTYFKFAPLICYESIYGDFCAKQCRQKAELICVITNDGWWKDTPGYKQHMSFARLRAIENRRWVARSANTGTSCFINQRGDVTQKTKWWTQDVLSEKVVLNSEATFYTRFGDWLGLLSIILVIPSVLFAAFKRFPSRKKV